MLEGCNCGSENREHVFSFVAEEIRALMIRSSLAIVHLAGNTHYGGNRGLDKKNYPNYHFLLNLSAFFSYTSIVRKCVLLTLGPLVRVRRGD